MRPSYLMQAVGIPERTLFSFLVLDQIAGPVIISAFLFFAVLANFIIRGALQLTSDDGLLIIPDPLKFSSRTVSLLPCVPLASIESCLLQ